MEPEHLSWYQLTLEPNTAFHRRPPSLPDEAGILEIESAGRALLAAHGFRRYEISAYRRGEHRCGHNLNYWQFGDYLGIGAGAQGKVTIACDGSILRRAKPRNPRTYVEQAGSTAAVSVERVDGEQRALEFMMNALRLPDGIHTALFEERTGLPLAAVAAPLQAAAARGWLRSDTERIEPTPAGLTLLNSMLELFVPEPERAAKARARDRHSPGLAALGAADRSTADQPL